MPTQSIFRRIHTRLLRDSIRRVNNLDFHSAARQVEGNSPDPTGQKPVIFFDASTRLEGVSLNAGFALLSAWSMQLQGIPVIHFVCASGMQPCILGTNRKDPDARPPCAGCKKQSREIFSDSNLVTFRYLPNEKLEHLLEGLSLEELMNFEMQSIPLGKLVLPSIRWILRRHALEDDAITLKLYRNYIKSAWSLAIQFELLILENSPQQVVVFNGMQYPEATARWIARKHGIRVISHEVGLLPFTGYFTEGDATAYDLNIPESFKLNPKQNEKLDCYLTARFKGDFHMAGVQFWPEMSDLTPEFRQLAQGFENIVPVFTNVIFDTSQPHANILFEDMFAWLDLVLDISKNYPKTLFVIRAHPDESRPGKASEQSVEQWAKNRGVSEYPNIHFIPPHEYVNSYDLIRMAKFVLVYNSTIGLEASILGGAVLSAGKSRYSASDVVWLPGSKADYLAKLEEFLQAESVQPEKHFKINARRFLYWQLYRSSLSFEDFLESDGVWAGYVKLKEFDWKALLPQNSPTFKALSDGILNNGDFMLKETAE